MTNENRLARRAGLACLVVVAAGFFSLGYVPGKVAAPGNPQAMLDNIVSHEGLFRAGIASFVVEQVAFLLLPLLLFWLLSAVNRVAAAAIVALAVTAVPIALVGKNGARDNFHGASPRRMRHAAGRSDACARFEWRKPARCVRFDGSLSSRGSVGSFAASLHRHYPMQLRMEQMRSF